MSSTDKEHVIPEFHKALVISTHGGLEVLKVQEVPTSRPKGHQVLIKVKAVGLNHLDTWVRRGVTGHRFPLPLVPGSDMAGSVVAWGEEVTGLQRGDRVLVNPAVVCGLCRPCQDGDDHLCVKWGLMGETTSGGFQDYILVSQSQLHHLPQNLSFEKAAAVPINFVTAWEMLVSKAKIRPNQTILIHGAGSGVSVASLQIAKLFGLQIFVTSSSEEKLERCKGLGAHRFIHTKKDTFRDVVRHHTAKQGVDVVVDHVGSATLAESVRCLKRGGILVSCGATTGAEISLDWKQVFFKNLALIGSTYGPRRVFHQVMASVERGLLHPVVDEVLEWDQIPEGHRRIESREVFGKLVVKI